MGRIHVFIKELGLRKMHLIELKAGIKHEKQGVPHASTLKWRLIAHNDCVCLSFVLLTLETQ